MVTQVTVNFWAHVRVKLNNKLSHFTILYPHHTLPCSAPHQWSINNTTTSSLTCPWQHHTFTTQRNKQTEKDFEAVSKAELYNHVYNHDRQHFHLLPSIIPPQTSHPPTNMSQSIASNRLTPLTFHVAIRWKLRLTVYPSGIQCSSGHHTHTQRASIYRYTYIPGMELNTIFIIHYRAATACPT